MRDAEIVKTITDPDQVRAAARFAGAKKCGWKDPIAGPRVPQYLLQFFNASRGVGRRQSSVNIWGVIALCDGALAVLMAVEWRGLLVRHHRDTGRRSRASLVGFEMATVALLLELVIAGAALCYGSLGALDEASQQSGTSAYLAIVVLCSFVAAGVLSLGAVILVLVGTGPRRASTVVYSAAVLLGFVVMLVVAINSFH